MVFIVSVVSIIRECKKKLLHSSAHYTPHFCKALNVMFQQGRHVNNSDSLERAFLHCITFPQLTGETF